MGNLYHTSKKPDDPVIQTPIEVHFLGRRQRAFLVKWGDTH